MSRNTGIVRAQLRLLVSRLFLPPSTLLPSNVGNRHQPHKFKWTILKTSKCKKIGRMKKGAMESCPFLPRRYCVGLLIYIEDDDGLILTKRIVGSGRAGKFRPSTNLVAAAASRRSTFRRLPVCHFGSIHWPPYSQGWSVTLIHWLTKFRDDV